jgi:hypothetical protein
MELPHPGNRLAPAKTATTGVRIETEPTGCLLAANTTYFFTGDARGALITSFGIKWDAALIAVISIEDTNFDVDIVTDYDATAGNGWVGEVPAPYPIAPGGSGALASGVITLAGGNAGAALAHLSGLGSRRQRVKVVVGGTGGRLAIAPHGKA